MIAPFCFGPHFTTSKWFYLFCILQLSLLVYYLYKKRLEYFINKNKKERALQEAMLKIKIAELSTFRNQFNPHFIFNSLNSIQAYIIKNEVRQASSFLSKFSKLMRESLILSDQKYVSIDREFNFIRAYLEMEFLRFPEKFKYEFHNKEELSLAYFLVPPLLMQPVVENVVKHAFKGQDVGKLDIIIKSGESENSLEIIITDDGNGLKEDTKKEYERKSYGMKIVDDRIKLLNIDFPNIRSSFIIKNQENSDGTIARFVIPKITMEHYDESNNSRRRKQ